MKSSLKLSSLPCLLAISLALSACQNASSPMDTEVQNTTHKTSESISSSEPVNQTRTETETVSVSAKQQMIDTLSSYRWTLDMAMDGSNQPLQPLMSIKNQVILTFNQYQNSNTLSYSVGCNTIGASYEIQGNTLTIEDTMSTKMSCEDLNIAENQLNELMQGESQLSLAEGEAPTLTQVTSDSTNLVWIGKMTPQAKYKNKGETVFWAIKAATKPCAGDSERMCLQVRPVTYDEQGIKASEGKWAEFSGTIDGYQHDDKHDEVLRLQRYKLDASTASVATSGEEYAYVLDTIIESTIVK